MTKHLNHQVCQPNCPAYTPTNTRISEILESFARRRRDIASLVLPLADAQERNKNILSEATQALSQLLADEVSKVEKRASLERSRHVVTEGELQQQLNEVKNAVRVLSELERKESKSELR